MNARCQSAVRWSFTAALVIDALLASLACASDWPQWRGPGRDNVCDESDLLTTLPEEGLTVRWSVPVGYGFASPVVADGRVYLADSLLESPTALERLHCYDEQTGDELWTHSYEVHYEEWAFDPTQEIGPVATPIVQDRKIYTVGRVGDLYCLDAVTGDEHWHKSLGEKYEVRFAPGAPSPLIEGDLLILMAGGKNGACVIALHKDTGDEAWTALNEKMTYSSPIVITSGGARQLIVWTEESLTSLDPRNGATYWRQELLSGSDYIVSTPVFQNDRLLIGGLMLALHAGQPGATVLWPDPDEPANTVYSDTSTAMLLEDHVYSARSSGQLICVNAVTGEEVWESDQVTRIGGGASIHMTANGDSVLLYTDRGELIRARLSAEGYTELGRAAVLEPTMPFGGANVAWSAPAFANGHVFARSGKELVCVSLSNTR